MYEKMIDSIIKEAKSPLSMFRRVVTKELKIPPVAQGQVIDQLMNSWKKSGGNKDYFFSLIESATATQSFANQLTLQPNLSIAIDKFKGE